MNAASSVPTRSPRLHSLDALRGLDMLIILGLDALILLLAAITAITTAIAAKSTETAPKILAAS